MDAPPPPPMSPEQQALVPLCAVFRRHLKSLGLKYTPERAGVLAAITENDDPFEVEVLLDELQRRGLRVSKATVYRTVRLLQDAGIISPAVVDAKQTHYQLVHGRPNLDVMVCTDTGECVTIQAPELEAIRDRIAREHGWRALSHRFQIYATSD